MGIRTMTSVITLSPHKCRRLVRILCLLALLMAALLQLGCSPLQPGSPVVRDFTFIGQTPADPRRFCFMVEWTDEEGDLASTETAGELRFTLENLTAQQAPQTLSPYKLTTALVPNNPTAGVFPSVCIDFREPSGVWPERFKLTAQLIDSLGNKSNEAWLIMKIKP